MKRIPRTCTEIREGDGGDGEWRREADSKLLKEFRSLPAYVLLGDPGAGKTTAFEMECEALGERACMVTARDFLTFDPQNHPEWQGKTLFIDGLDEVRAGSPDARPSFDAIRTRLDTLRKPHFRLSCREADWLGANDRERLQSVSPDSTVTMLRLDPLTDSDVESMLDDYPGMDQDVQAFIRMAHDKGVNGFLENPQTLNLLAEVVGAGGAWPASRMELFEKACLKMIRERNTEHQAAHDCNNPHSSEQLLNAAGQLCAVQLIAGAAGWTLRGEGNELYPALDKCDCARRDMLRPALATKLFKGVSNNCLAPIHRHIAEFLAARYLAGVIDEGLPARRVIALMTGGDGMVVTEMRGLSAWLAAHCSASRTYLIEQDPVGVGLYGDISTFFPEDKQRLLFCLKNEHFRLGYSGWQEAAAFRALAAPDMEPVLKDILTDADREEAHQKVVDLALRALQYGESLPGLSGLLLEIVRDDKRWPRVQYAALDAFICNAPDDENKVHQLKALLEDVRGERVADANNELLGALLTHLYPRHLSPSEVWEYFVETGNPPPINGRYYQFWQTRLKDVSSDEQVAALLDGLSARLAEWDLSLRLGNRKLYHLPTKLLLLGLQAHGDQIDSKRLYDWLEVGLKGAGGLHHSKEEILSGIRVWLEDRPDLQKAIIMEGLELCSASDSDCHFDICASRVDRRLYGANPPSDYGLWCLEQAVAMVDIEPHIARFLFDWAWDAHTDPALNKGLSLEVLQNHAAQNKMLAAALEQKMAPPSVAPEPQEWPPAQKQYVEEQRREKEKLLNHIRSNETALRENRAAPHLLYEIARRYFDGFSNAGKRDFASGRLEFGEQAGSVGGVQAVRKWLEGYGGLTEAALQGLRGVIDREDVPDVKDILDLEIQRHMHYLGLPFLASLEEMHRTMPEDDVSQWSEDRIRKAAIFYYCYGNHLHISSGYGYCPEWYGKLLAERPEIVADVLVQYGRCIFQVGQDYASPFVDKFQHLEYDADHEHVARLASLALLRAFPIQRSPEDQSCLVSLNHLFWAAIKHSDRASFQKLIDKKRSLKSMRAAQRVRWLAAGAILWPEKYTDILKYFVQEDQKNRVRYLKAFFGSRVHEGVSERRAWHTPSVAGRELFPFDPSKVHLWELFIRLMGSVVGPDWWGDHASGLVRMLIKDLAGSPKEEAAHALARLADDPALQSWRGVLKQAQEHQRIIRRDASYRHPDIEQVCKTLTNRSPANPADLAALLVDRLDEIGSKIRGGSTSDWRQYWNVDEYNRPLSREVDDGERSTDLSPSQRPEDTENSHDPSLSQRPEDACRDHLLSDLQEKLKPLGIDAQPEGQYVNDKRADIRVAHGGFNVPIEVKKNSHRKLWSALHNQLIAKYTMDPDTNGYGVYLVFWFGPEYTKTPHDEHGRPDNPEEMKQWLEASLSPEEARKISVCVIDVSRPEGK